MGKCQNGIDCQFRHVDSKTNQSNSRAECRHWKKTGNCNLGTLCHFAHDSTNRHQYEDSDSTDTTSDDEAELKVVVCRFWNKKGQCKHGENCKFSHPVNNPVQLEARINIDNVEEVSQTVDKKTVVCRFWKKKGSCTHGENCKFSHPVDKLVQLEARNSIDNVEEVNQGSTIDKKTVVCRFWKKKGTCTHGENCKFSHPLDQPVQIEATNNGDDSAEDINHDSDVDKKKSVVCRFWKKKGKCKHGENCKFSHPVDQPVQIEATNNGDDSAEDINHDSDVDKKKSIVCRFWKNKGKCKHGENCKFTHPVDEPVQLEATNNGDDSAEDINHGSDVDKTKSIVCRFWKKKGKCKHGENCKFTHQVDEPVQLEATNNGDDSAEDINHGSGVDKKKSIVCRFWKKKGKCLHGESCTYAHPDQVGALTRTSQKCYARIGLVGNPSDGFYGKTLSLALGNYSATVSLTSSVELQLIGHPFHDKSRYNSLAQHRNHVRLNGYYGGLRLIQATLTMFYDRCMLYKVDPHRLLQNFKLEYSTNIPRMVGLSGSSAIVYACFKALMQFYAIELSELNLTKATLPQLILEIEEKELGIKAGLQDRVIQVYGGLVHMDFNQSAMSSQGHGNYTSLDSSLLPPLYLVFDLKSAGDSGKAHSDVRQRYYDGDEAVINGMTEIAELADEAVLCLLNKNLDKLPSIMQRNFDIRRKLYGEACTGIRNIEMIDLAKQLGLVGKFTGSGGASVCMVNSSSSSSFYSSNNNDLNKKQGNSENKFLLSKEQENKICQTFNEAGFEFVKIDLPPPSSPLPV